MWRILGASLIILTPVIGTVAYVADERIIAPCDDEYLSAALDKVPWAGDYPWRGGPPDGDECSRNSPRCNTYTISDIRRKAASLRSWAFTLNDRCMRDAYIEWADHADRSLDEAEREMRTHAIANDYEAYKKQWASDRAKQNAVAATMPSPPTNY